MAVENFEIKKMNYASSYKRLMHYFIDIIVLVLIIQIIGRTYCYVFNTTFEENENIFTLLFILVYFLYHILMEYYFQKTVAKFITKTSVVNLNGKKPSKSLIIGRTFCRLIPFNTISWFILDIGFHDRLSNTRVINDE
jgi:uncharacterized RDD family membrane protein YckC